ncbi:hypothetical protein SFMTTN_0139 [Sulfuriferula multivorans]|uniref:Uncharacterized protein n=1 Tax=Sulfuriferula multivorans TaxID=1559896 RepID=A0A401J9U5_9PROT|nr:hypothetical protein SFMTTN_0139 [Sulfuriferula multivorans]
MRADVQAGLLHCGAGAVPEGCVVSFFIVFFLVEVLIVLLQIRI